MGMWAFIRKIGFVGFAACLAALSAAAPARAAGDVDAKKALAYAQYGNTVTAALKSVLAAQNIIMTDRELAPYRSCLVRTVQAMMPPGGMRALMADTNDYAQKLQKMNERITHNCVPFAVQAVKAKYPQAHGAAPGKSGKFRWH